MNWKRLSAILIIMVFAFGGSFSECSCHYGSNSVQKVPDDPNQK